LRDFIHRTKKLHDQRTAIKQLIDIQQDRLRARMDKFLATLVHGPTTVTPQSPNQQLIGISRASQNGHLCRCISQRGSLSNDFTQFNTSCGSNDHASAARESRRTGGRKNVGK
jgi:hypothetical protein